MIYLTLICLDLKCTWRCKQTTLFDRHRMTSEPKLYRSWIAREKFIFGGSYGDGIESGYKMGFRMYKILITEVFPVKSFPICSYRIYPDSLYLVVYRQLRPYNLYYIIIYIRNLFDMTSEQPSAMVYRVITLSFESRCYRQSLNALKYLAVVTSKLHHHRYKSCNKEKWIKKCIYTSPRRTYFSLTKRFNLASSFIIQVLQNARSPFLKNLLCSKSGIRYKL